MEYVTAIQAAGIIGVTERTIREWIKDGKLSAHHPFNHPNRLAIPLSEVEALARKRKQYYAEVPDMSEIVEKLATLEQKIEKLGQLEAKYAALEEKCAELEQRFHQWAAEWPSLDVGASDIDQIPRAQKRIVEKTRDVSSDKALPPGCVLARDFAKMYGVAPETFRDHYIKGLGPKGEEKDKAEVSNRPKPGRLKETEWYLTPEQQTEVLEYWDRHDVPITLPNETEE
jgi:hypothetical protein